MADMARRSRFSRYLRVVYRAAQRNLSVVAFVSALAFGGLTLLLYACSIGQLPEFTWNDLTGTLLAVCATGVLVVVFVVAYCLSAGYFARLALESVYPEAAHHVSAAPPDTPASIEPYMQLTRPPFILGATCFSILAWVGVFIGISSERLVPPHNEHLLGALITALAAVVILVLVDWGRFHRQWVRYSLLSILSGSIAMLIVIITTWSVGPSSLVMKSPVRVSGAAVAIDWVSYWVTALDHALGIGLSVTIGMMVLLNLASIMSHVGRFIRLLIRLIPWRWPNWLVLAVTSTSHIVVGDVSNRRLTKAKVYVTFCFYVFTSVVFLMAAAMAGMGNAHDWSKNFFFIATLLTFLNWASFSIRQWRGRAGLGLITALLVFLSYPLLAHNPIMFPKMVVSLLGLGNERLATIGLSSKQCATLAPYGANCISDNERTITLTNVNLLNRLGGSIVLELLVKDIKAYAKNTLATSAATVSLTTQLVHGESQQTTRTLVTTKKMETNDLSAMKCDELLLSRLESNDVIDPTALRCVVLVIPKDQVLGYTKASSRTYQGGYTAYQPGPAKAAVAKAIGGVTGATIDSTILSDASMVQ